MRHARLASEKSASATNVTAPTAKLPSSSGRTHAGSGRCVLASRAMVRSFTSASLEPAHVVDDVPAVARIADLVAVARHDAPAVPDDRVDVAVAALLGDVEREVGHVAELARHR